MVVLTWTSTGPEENLFGYRAQSWVLPSSGLQEAGERLGSTCAIEVAGLKRRPPTVGAAFALSLGLKV